MTKPTTPQFVAAAVLAALLIVGCGSSRGDVVAAAGDLGHIHDLLLDDQGELLVASHSGLYRIEGIDRAVLIGTEQHDLMSMTSLADGDLLASGHPDLRVEDYRVDDRPPFLGLARSGDGGVTWEVIDLLGDADFHALAPVDDGLFAAETSGRIWFFDNDGSWTELGEVDARDLAIDPVDSNRQLAPDYDGQVWGSSDGGATWHRIAGAPALVEIEWQQPETIVGIDEVGTVWTATAPTATWQRFAAGPADIETFFIDDAGDWWASVHGGAISHSTDRGLTWVDKYLPPLRS